MNQQTLRPALDRVREFISSLEVPNRVAEADDVSGWFGHGSDIAVWFWRENEGTRYLSGPEAQRYRDTLDLLVDAVRAQISPRAVEQAFQRTILTVLDLQNRRSGTPDLRLEQAIEELRGSLTAPPQTFRVYHQVNGLAADGLPTTIGNVEFVVFDDEELNRFRAAVREHRVSEEERERRYQDVEELLQQDDLAGCTMGVVEVAAIESGAAEPLAAGELRRTLDVINFYSDLIPYNRAFLSLPGDRDTAQKTVPQIVVKGRGRASYSVNHSNTGRVGELSLSKLREVDSERNFGFARVAELLAGCRGKLEEQIVTSIRWAGRATADSWGGFRNEEVFLLYAIALESLILSDQDKAELSYRLRLRVTHLLAGDSTSRRDLFDDVGHLYSIRSKLVHNGRYQVMDADLSLLRQVTKAALIRVCTRDEFQPMTNPTQLGKWFDDRILH